MQDLTARLADLERRKGRPDPDLHQRLPEGEQIQSQIDDIE